MLEWFTTIPGILIICGVILLIIAVVLFIVGAKKSKNEVKVSTDVMNEKPIEAMPTMETVVNPTPIEPVTVETANSNENVISTSVEEPNITFESVQISEPESVEVTTPEITTFESSVDNNVMDIPTVTEIPSMEDTSSTIYGGEDPIASFSVNEEKPVTIYGGNDPLEATQTLPKVEEHHEPYGGSYSEVRIVEPAQSIEVPTPVEEVVSAMPTVETPVEISMPEPSVIEIPSDDSEDQSTTAVEEVKPVVEEL